MNAEDDSRAALRAELAAEMEAWLFKEPYWGIDHALYWAATRDRKRMGEYFSPRERTVFGNTFRDGLMYMAMLDAKKSEIATRADIADIESAARRGLLVIEGKPDESSGWQSIPHGDWGGGPSFGGLSLFDGYAGPYAAAAGAVHKKIWINLRVRRQDVLRAFREGETEQPQAEEPEDVSLDDTIRAYAKLVVKPGMKKPERIEKIQQCFRDGGVDVPPATTRINEALAGTPYIKPRPSRRRHRP